eukprot:3718937-Prymnesium_polylepis.1
MDFHRTFPGWTEAFFASRRAALALAARVLGQSQLLLGAPPPWRLGILDRGHGALRRVWTQARKFVELVRGRRPDVRVDVWSMTNMTLRDQATSVRRHHLIISPHGAQNANFAFAAPCTAVLELFTRQYAIPMYLELANEVGARPFGMYPGSVDEM